MRLKACGIAFLILLVLITLLLPQFTSQERDRALSEKTAITFKLNIGSAKEASFDSYFGSSAKGEKLNRTQIALYPWEKNRKLWDHIPEVIPGKLGKFIKDNFNETANAENFINRILGCDSSVKRIIYVRYSKGISILGWVKLKGENIKPLKFLRGFKGLEEVADVNINVESEYGTECSELQLLHFRLVTKEVLIYSSVKNDLHLVNVAALSPLGGFIIVLVCTALSLSLSLYSRKYFRGERLYASIWVVAWLFYFLAFIPFSNYIFIIICAVGVAIASFKVIRAILKAHPKAPKKETLEPKEVTEKVEKYLK